MGCESTSWWDVVMRCHGCARGHVHALVHTALKDPVLAGQVLLVAPPSAACDLASVAAVPCVAVCIMSVQMLRGGYPDATL